MVRNQVYIIEDNADFALRLKQIVQAYFKKKDLEGIIVPYASIEVVGGAFENWIEDLKKEKMASKNLYILDVTLNEHITGFQIAQQIRRFDADGDILFVTSHVELMGQVFIHNLKALSFIHKHDPLMQQRLESALDQLFHEFKIKKNIQPHDLNGYKEKLSIQSQVHEDSNDRTALHGVLSYQYKNTYYRINFEEIFSIETDTFKRRLNIHTDNQIYPCQKKLSILLTDLPRAFIQIHRSIVVNINKVARVTSEDGNYSVILTNELVYPISRSFVSNVLDNMKN